MKFFAWILKSLWMGLKGLIVILLLWAAVQYLCAPVYDFPVKAKFSGKSIYNPYASCDTLQWKKAVFHIHSKSWGGVTNGASSEQQVFDRYTYLGYDVVTLSDYEKINKEKYPPQRAYIPNYEHGFGMKKNHHLNIGAKSVLFFDFMFPQTISNKQFMINLLRPRTELLALAHPDWNGAVKPEDVKQLCNYDLLEIKSNYRNSTNLWDTALSAGALVFLLCDDDGHDIRNPNIVGRCLTLVNSPITDQVSVIDALRKGKTIGVEVAAKQDESFETRKAIISKLPYLRYVKLAGDTLQLSLSDTAKEIKLLGDKGTVRKIVEKSTHANYVFQPNDTYIRAIITFRNGTIFYLNPLMRYDGKSFAEYHATVNILWTVLKNAFFAVILILIALKYFRRRGKK